MMDSQYTKIIIPGSVLLDYMNNCDETEGLSDTQIAIVIDVEYDEEGIVEAALYVGAGNGDRGKELSYYGCHFQDGDAQ